MKEWIFSIIVTVLMTTIVSIISPEGRLGKLIKGIFSIILMLIIINPLINLSKNNNSVFKENFDVKNNISYEYLNYVNNLKSQKLSSDCEGLLKENGVENAEVTINYVLDEKMNFIISKVCINLENTVISDDKEHIVVNEEITSLISINLNIEKNKVIING